MLNNMAGYALSIIGAIFIGQLGALSLSSSVLANSVYNCTGGLERKENAGCLPCCDEMSVAANISKVSTTTQVGLQSNIARSVVGTSGALSLSSSVLAHRVYNCTGGLGENKMGRMEMHHGRLIVNHVRGSLRTVAFTRVAAHGCKLVLSAVSYVLSTEHHWGPS
jgi:hypothetical protein